MSRPGRKRTSPTPGTGRTPVASTSSMIESTTPIGTLSGRWPARPNITARSVECPLPVAPSDPMRSTTRRPIPASAASASSPDGCPVRASARQVAKWRPARMGPTVCEDDGPMPTRKTSRTDSGRGACRAGTCPEMTAAAPIGEPRPTAPVHAGAPASSVGAIGDVAAPIGEAAAARNGSGMSGRGLIVLLGCLWGRFAGRRHVAQRDSRTMARGGIEALPGAGTPAF